MMKMQGSQQYTGYPANQYSNIMKDNTISNTLIQRQKGNAYDRTSHSTVPNNVQTTYTRKKPNQLDILDPINQQILAIQRDIEVLDNRYLSYENKIVRK